MERGVGTFGDPSRLLNIASRIATIVLALILIGVAAGTIGIVSNNEALEAVRKYHNIYPTSAYTELYNLINQSLGAASWLIVVCVGVLIAEIVITILEIANVQTMKLIIQIIDTIFSIAVALSYGSTGIACAVFAAAWGKPPQGCEYSPHACDVIPLTATNALSTVFSFIQTAVFGSIALFVIYTIVKSMKA